jgi:large subunit ribosomal protein L23
MKHYSEIILAPLITEKGPLVGEQGKVASGANKVEIKQAIEEFFEVKVEKVRTSRLLGKTRRVGRHVGRKPSWKKAYVTLSEGDTIDFFEGA